jgi:uncharacterized protein (DUF488 family)
MIYTIGHSNHPIAHFLALLRGAGIQCVADVRSVPFSRRFPQFSQKALAASLKDAGIAYWFLGDALGARPKDPTCYDNGKASHARIAATPAFKAAIDALIGKSASTRIALMCAEREPLDCHRTILVSRALALRGCDIAHILADGRIMPHSEIEQLLLTMAREGDDLFGDREAALGRAYDKRAGRMEFTAG